MKKILTAVLAVFVLAGTTVFAQESETTNTVSQVSTPAPAPVQTPANDFLSSLKVTTGLNLSVIGFSPFV